jgi:hypothetical protein
VSWKRWYGALAIGCFTMGIVHASLGMWGWAAFMLVFLIFNLYFYGAEQDEEMAARVTIVDAPEYDTQTDILRKGYEPAETPTDEDTAKVQEAWQTHRDNCKSCDAIYLRYEREKDA